MLIYSNNRVNDTLFGDVNYKSAYDPEHSINRTRAFKRCTHRKQQQQQNKRSRTKYKQNRKKLTVRNIKFLKSLGLQVKK